MTDHTPNPYSPRENFFRAWGKDAQGRWVYVGLDHEETQELLRLQGSTLDGDDLVITGPSASAEHNDRYLELHDKHEAVRQQICAREVAARYGVADKPH